MGGEKDFFVRTRKAGIVREEGFFRKGKGEDGKQKVRHSELENICSRLDSESVKRY